MRRYALPFILLATSLAQAQKPVVVRMMAGPYQGIPAREATDSRSQARWSVFEEFHRQNPDIEVVNAGGLELANEIAESSFLISMAADTAPDVFYVNFRQYTNYIEQGFCRPLDDLIAKDPDVTKRFNPLIMDVVHSYDGRTYAVPFYQVAQALYYRKDHFAEAGLDPGKPPRTWDEFYADAQRLTESAPGRSGFVFSAGLTGKAYWWINFVWQAGGEVVVPAGNGYSRSAIDSPEAAVALDFFRKLAVQKWTKGGKTYGPAASVSPTFSQDIAAGKVSMWFAYTNDVVMSVSDLNPALVGIAAMPAGPGGSKNEINAGMWAINANVTDPKKLEACWRFIKFFVGQDAARVQTKALVDLGLSNLVNPVLLKEFGYGDLAALVDPAYVAANESLFTTGKPEPNGRNCQQVYVVLDDALDRAMLEPTTPARSILHDVAKEMDAKLLGYTPAEVMARRRGWAAGIMVCLAGLVLALVVWLARRARSAAAVVESRPLATAERKSAARFLSIALAPACVSVLVWAYWPLLHGLVIAFQDYRIMKPAQWVGMDNFISVATAGIFWKSLWNSFIYVGLTIVIGFFIPLFLALALNEIPRFKVFFRTVFYLPAMTSSIVIAFLWRQFYDKSETGVLNSLAAPVFNGINHLFHTNLPLAHDWLGDPTWAMFAVVLPGIWAGAGPGSILYLAALKNVPGERYEAADIDGATWWHKVRYIALPGLKPLILINLLGVFIAGFKAMETIFVLTGGGPLNATHTIGLEVWTNAFVFLKFGYATAAAWVMGAILIGFTVVQIRYLTKLRFTAARL